MKVGNISQTIWKMNIGKILSKSATGEEALFAPSYEEMCSALSLDDEEAVFTSSCVSGASEKLGVYGILRAVNDLAARGALPAGVSATVLLPKDAEEAILLSMTEQMEAACSKSGVQLTCVRAEVLPVVSRTVVFVAAVGTARREYLMQCSKAGPGQEIVLLGTAGLEGALRILDEQEEELSKRFVPAFLHQTKQLSEYLYALPWMLEARQVGVTAMQQIGSGGILAALWELLEASGLGMEIEMSQIAVQQETVEICEYYRLNPYQMTSAGSVLMTTEHADELIARLKRAGARAGKLGITTDTPARVILGQSEKRFLDRPQPDELAAWQERIYASHVRA